MKLKKLVALTLCAAFTVFTCSVGAVAATATPAQENCIDWSFLFGNDLQIGQAYAAAHGTKCFTEAVAVVKGDVIVAAHIDDFQFGTAGDVVGVPNSDAGFASGYAEGKVLYSKRANAAYYSNNMKRAGSTVAIDANFDAIQNFVAGKTIAELEALAEAPDVVDSVSGATLADTAGYIKAIVAAAKNAQGNAVVNYRGDLNSLKLNVTYTAAHGTKCFASAAALTDDTTLVLSYIDEFQFTSKGDGIVGVPNSENGFAAGYADGMVLISKRVNTTYYSELMASHAGATVTIDANYDAIQNHINGMRLNDVAALADRSDAVDAISGATLVDTVGYLNAVLAAAKG